jgi:bifunctional UDP-N-acetylglucosamine pyrophosphorylase/glucosamine-1-phosphate N-acetyltransferase
VIGLLRRAGQRVGAVVSPDPDVVLGVNTRVELAEIGTILRKRILNALMLSGVTVEDPQTTFVEAGVRIGADTTLRPFTTLSGDTIIGENCEIGPQAHIADSRLGNDVRARACFIEQATVGDECRIGPFANLRPGTRLGRAVKIGDFVETKNADIGDFVSAGHLAYLGDATVGADTNIGAGTITCNYDGLRKHQTIIGAHAFVGSHTTLVAPVRSATRRSRPPGRSSRKTCRPTRSASGASAKSTRKVGRPPARVTATATVTPCSPTPKARRRPDDFPAPRAAKRRLQPAPVLRQRPSRARRRHRPAVGRAARPHDHHALQGRRDSRAG